jgi:predicted transposase YbfD/YdcC
MWRAESGLMLGQRSAGVKSNELTAVPERLNLLFAKGCIVTVDALNSHKDY